LSGALYLHHPSSLEHDTGGHPERAERIVTIERELASREWLGYERQEAPAVPREVLEAVHPRDYVAAIERISADGGGMLDLDTVASRGSFEAALHAAGGPVRAVDELLDGHSGPAFCALRPPGHHAEPSRAMGFCLFNNVAVAARFALDARGVQRAFVLDWDVHHGNGTNDIFYGTDEVLYASIHESPLYPGTGALSEAGVGNIFNAPLRPGDGGDQFREAFESRILPALRNFAPDVVLISAGFDAHKDDPLANLQLAEADFAWVSAKIAEMADRFAQGRLVSMLEGGYNLAALAKSAAVHVNVLMQAGR